MSITNSDVNKIVREQLDIKKKKDEKSVAKKFNKFLSQKIANKPIVKDSNISISARNLTRDYASPSDDINRFYNKQFAEEKRQLFFS